MPFRCFVACLAGCLAALTTAATCPASPASADETSATIPAAGVVFHDANGNGVRDAGEKGLPDVRVSNGREVVLTDQNGSYRLPVDNDDILFVIKPRDWMTPIDELNLPRFYYIHKPAGSPRLKYSAVQPTGPLPASIDFPLVKRPEPDRFDVLLFGDTQPANLRDIEYLAHDIIEPVVGIDAAFGMSLGDLVSDNLALHEPLNRVVAHVGIPFHNVIGNHDMDYQAADDRHSDDHFESVYGPPYYSFDYGPVHFIVLDNIVWHGKTATDDGHYTAGLGPEQMEFLRSDLTLVPRDQLVVLTMHIPIIEAADRVELYSLLAEHPHAVSFSAHWHQHRHWFLGPEDGWPGAEPHHHMTLVTACGCWWHGAPDEVGLPHAMTQDGVPNGWFVATFDGTRCSVRFQPARRPADYQMNIHAPESVKAAQAAETEVLVNVFVGSQRSIVEMRFAGGDWVKLERIKREDPYYLALKEAEQTDPPPRRRKLPAPRIPTHLWHGHLPANPPVGTYLIEVRTTDVFGHTYMGRRIIRIR